MANTVYPEALDALLGADADVAATTLYMQAYDGATYNAAHDFLNDVGGTKVGSPVALTSVSISSGLVTATVPQFTWPAGNTVDALLLYLDGASDAARRLLAFIDERADGTALNITTTGGTANLSWSGPIFSIGGG